MLTRLPLLVRCDREKRNEIYKQDQESGTESNVDACTRSCGAGGIVSHRSAGGGWWWWVVVPRRRHAPEAKRESQATSGVPRRTRPTGTIQSCSRAGWNATAHHTSTPAPASPTAATPAATAQHAHDQAHPAPAPVDDRPLPAPPISMAAATAPSPLAPRDPCCGAIPGSAS